MAVEWRAHYCEPCSSACLDSSRGQGCVVPQGGQRDGEDAVAVREGVLAEIEHDADAEAIT